MPVETLKSAKEFGLEVTESLVWQAWEPGREYTKTIVLKNVNPKTKKVKYRIPNMKYFITKYPQPIMLGSGTSVKLPVTFRPINKEIYEDCITFHTQDGQFVIPMKALLPESKIVLPEAINFGLSAVKDQTDQTFEIHNLSNITTPFYFDKMEQPFSISPSTGTILPKDKVLIKASFKPEAAKVYSFAAWCTFERAAEDQRRKTITFQGIGKFPYLCLKTDNQSGNKLTVDFGKCPVGKERSKTVEIENMTPVNAAFQVLQTSHVTVLEQVFTCSQYHGTIPKMSSLPIRISFKSNTPGMVYADELKLCTIGTPGTSTIKCIATSVGPDVSVKIPYVNFGVTTIGKPVTRSFQVSNASDCGSVFEFENDNRYSAFQLDVITGDLEANSSRTVVVTFSPRAPINYYKKLVCLIHNQEPVFVHLFGTCHSEDSKPEILRKVHLERYEINAQRGITRLPPEELEQLKEEGKIVLQEDGTFEAVDIILQDELHKEHCALAAYEEYFNDDPIGEKPLKTPHVSADIREIDFGRCSSGETYHKNVTIANHTKGKVTCRWMTGLENTPFSIWPEELDIKPLTSASFQVTFKPSSTSQFFDARLEAYVYFKSMRDHKLVKDYAFCPPWCLNVAALGHTFPERAETFVPKCKWDSSTMIFPPVSQSSGSYKSMLLSNVGNNPLHFEFETRISSVFSCKPSMGLCRNQHKIIVFRMLPSPPGTVKEIIKRKANTMEKYSEMVTLSGTSEGPAVEMTPKDVVYFKPTCVGASSSREVTVKNITRIPLKFRWSVPKASQKYFTVEKREGIVEPLETQTHSWSFLPDAVERHICKVSLVVSNPNDNAEVPFKSILRLTGEGLIGSLSVTPNEVDFDKIVIGTSAKREIKVLNNSDCTLHYRLQVRQSLNGPYGDDEVNKDAVVLELDHDNFALPARAKKSLTLTVYPWRRVQYSTQLLYQLLGIDQESGETCVVSEAKPLCTVRVTGVYPSITVTDVRGTGCLITLRKARLWELLSIDRFNKYLHGDPGKEELRYAVATRHSTRRRMPVNTRAIMDFDFNSAPHGADPSIFYLCLENGGASDACWSFLFPTDLQLEMEYWSQTGEFDDDELHEMFVMDNQLFSIHPRKGVLSPGGSAVVVLTYSHTAVGVHKLPVLFKISRGREIVLNFLGTTLDPSTCHLHFSSFSHVFTPLAIGNIVPPIQRYQLFNGGAQTVRFQLDLSALEAVEKENFNWKVLECLTPNGQIPPGSTFDLLWIFAPLEPKMYTVDIPLHVQGGESSLLTFTGVGFDPNLMGPTMTIAESALNSIPESQKIQVEEQLLYLSEERVDFGNVPLFARNRKILYMENKSSEYTVSFNWKLTHGDLDMVIQMEPDHGYIEPLGKRMCKITFYSESFPAIYDVDIICEVVNETEMERYNQEFIKWHQRQEEKKHLFTITEKTLALEQAAKQSKRASSGKTQERFSPNQEKAINRYNALPPIGSFEGLNEEALADLQADPIPWPPRSFLVHLNVQGRTFTVEEFNKKFAMLSDFYFPKRAPCPSEFTETPVTSPVTSPELETLEIVLKMILRDVIVDKDFKGVLRQIHGEPVPYFGMINSTQRKSRESPFTPEHNQPTDVKTRSRVVELDIKPKESSFSEKVGEHQSGNVNGDPTESKVALGDESYLREKEMPPLHILKRSEEVRFMLESLLENTIFNILAEASHGEISLTARPRFVGLPPSAKGRQRSRTPLN